MQKLLFQLDEFAEYLQAEALTISKLQNRQPPLLEQPQDDQQSDLNTAQQKLSFLQNTTKVLFEFLKEELMELAVQLQKELTKQASQSELWQCINYLKGRQGELQNKLASKAQQLARLRGRLGEQGLVEERLEAITLQLQDHKIHRDKLSVELQREIKANSVLTLTIKQLTLQNNACNKQLQSALLVQQSFKTLQLQNEALSKANRQLSQQNADFQLKLKRRQQMDQESVRQAIRQAVQSKQRQLQQQLSQNSIMSRLARVLG